MPNEQTHAPSPARPRRWLLFVGLFSALTHGLYAFYAPDPVESGGSADVLTRDLSPDEREYLQLARSLADSGDLRLPSGDVAKRPPLYPAFLWVIYTTQGERYWLNAAILAQSFVAWCSSLLIALVAERLGGRRAGLLAGCIAAMYAPFLYLESVFLTETLVNLLFLAAVAVYVGLLTRQASPGSSRAPGSPARALAGVSALVGLATLARPNACILLIPFMVHALLHRRRMNGSAPVALAALVLPAALLVGGWMWRNYSLLGSPVLSSTGGINFYLGNNADYARNPGLANADYDRFDRLRREGGLTELQADRRLREEAWQYIRENPGQSLRNALTKVGVWFTRTIEGFGPVLLIILAGTLVGASWRVPPKDRPDSAGVAKSDSSGSVPSADRRRRLFRWLSLLALAATILAEIGHLSSDTVRKLPFVAPAHVLILGIPAVLVLRSSVGIRSLFFLLVASQLFVAVAFIPLSRVRWTIDAVFILALAVVVSTACDSFRQRDVVQ